MFYCAGDIQINWIIALGVTGMNLGRYFLGHMLPQLKSILNNQSYDYHCSYVTSQDFIQCHWIKVVPKHF